MLMHVVLFRPRPDLQAAEAEALIASLATAAREIATVRGFRVGRRLEAGPVYSAYSAEAGVDFPFVAVVEFDDRAGLDAYLAHPAHVALGQAFNAGLAATMVFDYDVREAGAGLASFLLGGAEDRASGRR